MSRHSVETLVAEAGELVARRRQRACSCSASPTRRTSEALGRLGRRRDRAARPARAARRASRSSCWSPTSASASTRSHGHCGVIRDGEVVNDETLELIARTAVSHVEAGADVVCAERHDGRPRGRDPRGARRRGRRRSSPTPPSTPPRSTARSARRPTRRPRSATAAATRWIPANVREALRECELDVAEGADVLMVKPALPYLDVIRAVRERFDAAGRRVQRLRRVRDGEGRGGERAGSTSAQAALESLTAIRRAGADLVVTLLGEGRSPRGCDDGSRLCAQRATKLIPGGVNSPVRAMKRGRARGAVVRRAAARARTSRTSTAGATSTGSCPGGR